MRDALTVDCHFFSNEEVRLLETIVRGEHTIHGFRNANLRVYMPDKSPGQVSRILKR